MKKIFFLTFVAIVIPVVVFGFLGCMKKPDHTPDFGPQVQMTDIQESLSAVPPDVNTIKMDQYVSIDITQVVDTQAPVTLSQKLETVTVYDTKTDPTLIQWTFMVDMNELSAKGVWQNWKQPFPIAYQKETQTNSVPQSIPADALGTSRMSAFSLKALKAEEEATPTVKRTYHNLQREDGFMPVPVLVKSKPDCGGVKNCDQGLRYTKVTFDQVVWDSEDHGTRTKYTITYSPDIPTHIMDWSNPGGIYPTNQFQFCAQSWIEIANGDQKQVVPVQQCANMRDFQFGHDVP